MNFEGDSFWLRKVLQDTRQQGHRENSSGMTQTVSSRFSSYLHNLMLSSPEVSSESKVAQANAKGCVTTAASAGTNHPHESSNTEVVLNGKVSGTAWQIEKQQ